jgi:hypothetical protein
MKKVLLPIFSMLLAGALNAQQPFTVGGSGMTLKSGTIVSIDSLALVPSANYTLTSNSLSLSYAATSAPGAASISRVYSFSTPLNAYNGGVGIEYAAADLNGNTPTALAIAYSTNGSTWSVDGTGTYVPNYVNTSGVAFTASALKSITGVNARKYYSKSTGDVTLTSNWGTNTDGSGNHPADFLGALNTYELSNISGTITLANNFNIGGLFIIDAGIDLEIGNKTLTLGDSIVCNGTIGGNGNSILIIGGRAMSVKFNSVNYNLGTVTINSNAHLTLQDTMGISADPIPGVLTIGIGGGLITSNYLVLQSDSNGTARIGTVSGTITGNVTVKQYTPGGRRAYRFWAHPFSGAIPLSQLQTYIDITGGGGSTNGFTTTVSNAPSAYWYNTLYGNSSAGNDPGWRAFTNTYGMPDSNMLHKYEGARIFIRGSKGEGLTGAAYTVSPATIAMYGAVNTGNITMPLSRGSLTVGGSPVQDYNLLGNPYPSPVDINSVLSSASSSGYINGSAFYVWNPYMGTSGQFETKIIGSSYILSANTSFEVRASGATGAALNFTESSKSTGSTEALHRNAPGDFLIFSIYDTSYHKWDQLYVQLNDLATNGEDGKYDAGKPPSPASLNFYSISTDNTRLSLDARPYQANAIIPLGIISSYVQDFILKADQLPVPSNVKVYLHDKLLQKEQLLNDNPEYRFTITNDVASQGEGRFELRFDSTARTPVQYASSARLQLSPNPATDQVAIYYNSENTAAKTLQLVNATGAIIKVQQLGAGGQGSIQVDVAGLASGAYLVIVTSSNEKLVQTLIKE